MNEEEFDREEEAWEKLTTEEKEILLDKLAKERKIRMDKFAKEEEERYSAYLLWEKERAKTSTCVEDEIAF